MEFKQAWTAPPTDSVTVDVSYSEPAPSAEELVSYSLDSLLGFRLTGAAYQIRLLEDGFVVIDRKGGQLTRIDSLGQKVALAPMTGVADPSGAAICVSRDSALIVDGSTLINQPRHLIWLSLRSDRDTMVAVPSEAELPPWSLEVSCSRVAGRWVLRSSQLQTPGDLAGPTTITLHEVSPEDGASAKSIFDLVDRSSRLPDSIRREPTHSTPWTPPRIVVASESGRLFVLDGTSGVVHILELGTIGARLRGITPRPSLLTRAMIDSVAIAHRAAEEKSMIANGSATPENVKLLDDLEQSIRKTEPGVLLPEIGRLVAGSDGSFALKASEWLVPDRHRWDLFDRDGGYQGAIDLSTSSVVLGTSRGTLWYVQLAGDSAMGAPELVQVRPTKSSH